MPIALDKLTPLLVVTAIEPHLPTYQSLGYEVAVRVPDSGTLDFAILNGAAGELMMQTRRSLAADLPAVAERNPTHLFYCTVSSLTDAAAALVHAKALVPRRQTFYGANESWYELGEGFIVGLAEHAQ